MEPEVVGAAGRGDLDTLSRLIGADPARVNERGWMDGTPLHAAALAGSVEAVALLLRAGGDPRARRENGDTPLHRAATAEIVELLVQAAGERTPDQQNVHGQTPLHIARDAAVAAALLRLGSSLAARDTLFGRTPLHETNLAKARVLLAAGADLHARDEMGWTPLHTAIWRRDPELVEFLLSAGADPTVRDGSGTSPVHLARSHGHEGVRVLLETAHRVSGRSLADASGADAAAHALRLDSGGAVSVAGSATLVRWTFDGRPRPAAIVPTEHARVRHLAINPHLDLVAVAPATSSIGPGTAPVELRRRVDFALVETLPEVVDATALALSPDGRRLAAGLRRERVVLVDLATRRITAEVEGGEFTGCVAFSPDGALLAAACSFQGGAHVRIDRVTGGSLEPVRTIDRADYQTPGERFVDEIPAVVFTPDGRHLLIWETCGICEDQRPAGWRGTAVLVHPVTGEVRWERSIDAGTSTLLAEARPGGFLTRPCVTPDGSGVVIALDGVVVLLDTADGTTRGVLPLSGRGNAVCATADALIVATDQGLRTIRL